jgi:hypothetical protein
MGVLLAFMFVWNMVGALILLPALAYFLLPPQPQATSTEEGTDQALVTLKSHSTAKAARRATVLEVRHEG